MKTLFRYVIAGCAVAAALLTSAACTDPVGPDTSPTPAPTATPEPRQPSTAIFDIPASLTGVQAATASLRSVEGSNLVAGTVEAYYSLVRQQVAFGAELVQGVKNLLADIEAVEIDGVPLLDTAADFDLTNSTSLVRYRWTVVDTDTWRLEQWEDSQKTLELEFSRTDGVYQGSILADWAVLEGRDIMAAQVAPAMVRVDFDSDTDGAGTASMDIALQDFRTLPDIASDTTSDEYMDALISFTRQADGVVTLASGIRVPNSRHFVWNGYLDAASGADTLNTAASAETRYYCAVGESTGTGTGQATIYMGIPKDAIVPATVFTDYGLGSLVGQLYTDRINNDYDFDVMADNATSDSDEGHDWINRLNQSPFNAGLATGNPASNTALAIKTALLDAVTTLENLSYPVPLTLEWLAGLMQVANPAYFTGTDYTANGIAPDETWPVISDAASRLPSQTDLDQLALAFAWGD